jgi:ATP-binding cassette subfamily B (MDR/TAP) protein 10
MTRLSSDTNVMIRSLTDNISNGLRALLQGVGGVSILFYIAPQLTLLMLMVIPPVGFGGVYYGRFVKKISKKVQDALASASDVVEEKFGNIRTVKSFGQEATELSLYKGITIFLCSFLLEKIQHIYELARKSAMASAGFFAGFHLAGNVALLAVLSYGGQMVMDQQMTVGDLTSFLLYSVYVMFSSSQLSTIYGG